MQPHRPWFDPSHYRSVVAKTAGIVAVLTLPIVVSSNIPPLYWIYLLLLLIYLTFAFESVRHYLSRYRDAFTVISILVAVLIFIVSRYESDLRTARILAAENRFNYEQAMTFAGGSRITGLFSLSNYRPNFDFILRRYGSECANWYSDAITTMEQFNISREANPQTFETIVTSLRHIAENCR